MVILSDFLAYRSFPVVAVEPLALQRMKDAGSGSKTFRSLVRILECVLQVTGDRLPSEALGTSHFAEVSVRVVGAINSDRFCALSRMVRQALTSAWFKLYSRITAGMELDGSSLRGAISNRDHDGIDRAVALFEQLELDDAKIRLYRAWPVNSLTGETTYLHLYPVYERMGETFTQMLYQTTSTFIASRRKGRLPPCFNELCTFIAEYNEKIDASDLLEPQFMARFLREFCVYFFVTGWANGNGRTVHHLLSSWSAYIWFHREYLESASLVARPEGAYPTPPKPTLYRPTPHLSKRQDGAEVVHKLLTPVPLQLTDSDALTFLFHSVRKDLEDIVTWAKAEINATWERWERREASKHAGEVRTIGQTTLNNGGRWLTSRANPEYLRNAASTYEHYGHLTQKDAKVPLLYPQPLALTAWELALPLSGCLLPYCALLVARHPAITPSFLETLMLFDKAGQLSGLVETDGGTKLVGAKHRRGARSAEQTVLLTPETLLVVQQIVELTAPIRKYLRERGDDTWRYLLLSCGMGFGYPLRWKYISAGTSNSDRLVDLAKQFQAHLKFSPEGARDLVERFSLARLRASAGVLVYLEERSVRKMADALGHKEYSPKLLRSYLPEPIVRFFSERWIRIFQNAFIVEVMKNRPLLLRMTDFATAEELNEFLLAHLLKVPKNLEGSPEDDFNPSEASPAQNAIFGVSPEILAFMLELSNSVASNPEIKCETTRYWAAVSAHLIEHIETNMHDREDVQDCLVRARSLVRNESKPAWI